MRPVQWLPVLAAVVLGLASPLQAQPISNRTLSLDDIIEIALAKNPGLSAARQEVKASDFGRTISRGKRFGELEAFGENLYAGFDDANERRLIPRAFLLPERSQDDVFGRNTTTAGFSYRIPLYTGGRLTARVELSEFAARASRHRLQQTADDLILNLTTTFHTLLRLGEDIKATEASLKALEESSRVTERAVEVGRRPRLDLLKVNTRLASVRQALIRRRNSKIVAQGALVTLMGLEDVTRRVQLAGPLRYIPQPIDLHQSIKEALGRRPAYQGLKQEVAIAEKRVQIAQSRKWPQISLRLGYLGATNDEDMGRVQDDFTAMLRVSIPLFTGGVLTGQVGEAKARLARARERLRQLRLSVSRGVQEAFFRVKDAEERIVAAQAALQQAAEALRIERLKLEVGKGIVEELLIAQRAELEARANYFSALAEANIASMALRRAVGVIRPINPQGRR
ncbi:MAG: TolC family protein [Acidobacteriota bacterium]